MRVLFVSFEETRVTSFFPSHPMHVASRFLFHSLHVNPFCSLRTLHFLHALHHMTDRTRYHHPSSSANIGFSLAKCTSGMKKMSSPAAFSNAALSPMLFSCSSLSRLFPRTSYCHPRMCAKNSSDSPGAAALPSTVTRLRTSLTFSTKLSPNLCMLTLVTAASLTPFARSLWVEDFALPAPRSTVSASGTPHTSHSSLSC